jgi:hypothetical protein
MSIYVWHMLRIQMSANKWSSTIRLSSHFFYPKNHTESANYRGFLSPVFGTENDLRFVFPRLGKELVRYKISIIIDKIVWVTFDLVWSTSR